MGPLVLGDGEIVGDGAQLRESILFPGTEVAPASILIGAIAGHRGILASPRRSGARRLGAPPASSAEAGRGSAQASS